MLSRPVILLPSCAYPEAVSDSSREFDLCLNIDYIRKFFPDSPIVVVDNGFLRPKLPVGVGLIHCPSLFTKNPSLGEARMLLVGASNIASGEVVLKMHSRCMLRNVKALKRLLNNKREFILMNRNIFGADLRGVNRFPYVDTRIFALEADLIRTIFNNAIRYLEGGVENLEQATLASFYELPQFANRVMSSGGFYPVFYGRSGHGRNYESSGSYIRSFLRCSAFRLGL